MRCFCLLFFALLLTSATIALGYKEDPELKQCKHQCEAQKQFSQEKIRTCVQKCEDYVREKQRREHGGGSTTFFEEEDDDMNRRSPIERLRECTKGCDRSKQRERCQSRCQETYEKEKERYEGGGGNPVDPEQEYQECRQECRRQSREGGSRRGTSQERCEERCQEQRRERQPGRREGGGGGIGMYEGREREEEEQQGRGNNLYVFEERHFFTGMETQHGRLRILPKFTDRSKLLKGIENYRVAILEAEPQTFIVPNHWDADTLIFVANGRGTVSLMRQERRESFNIKQGDIFRINAGTTAYLINRDSNQKLVLAKLLQPVNTPGQFEAFFGAGGENPESFYTAFSNEILEAAFNTRRDRLQRLFGQQKQGVIIKASEEQVRAMSHHEEGGIWPFGGESKGTFNLYDQRPIHSNEYGQLFEVDSSQFRQLRDLDIAISLANITQGAMIAPHYNSKSTKITVVVDGEGYFEMACPHISQSQSQGSQSQGGRQRQQQQGAGQRGYEKVSSRLKRGTVVVVPAGHPFVAVASNNQNLQLLCFEVNAYNNEKFTLAGRRNVMNQLEREAKELAFGMPAREVDEIFRSQKEEFFFKGPRQQGGSRSDA